MTPRDGAGRKPQADDTQPADQAPHYLRAVTDMSRTGNVVAREDIHAANGIELLARGARLNAGMLDRLLQHKLTIPLDAALETSDIVDAVALTRDLDAALTQDEMLGRIMQRSGDAQGWKWTLSQMPLHRDPGFPAYGDEERARSAVPAFALSCAAVACHRRAFVLECFRNAQPDAGGAFS